MRIKYSWLGISSVLIYTAISILSLQFNWGEGYEDRPILHYLCLFSGAFVLYVIVVLQIVRNYPEAPNLWMILLFGLLFRAAIFPANQIQEDDVYRYLWDGKVFANGINPYKYSPTEISSAKRLKIGDPEKFKTHYNIKEQEELLRLYQLKWENDRSVIFMERINHPAVPTIYPPFTQVIFRIVNQISPDNIYTMRLVFLLFDLIVLAFVILILQTLGRNPRFCIIYFWSPLVIKETFNSTHLDIVGVGILCSSLYFLVHRWRVSAMAFLALGTMSKFYPAILLPVYLRESIRNRPKGESKVTTWLIVGVCLTVFFAICTVFYWPFRDAGIGVFTGLKKFTTFWQSNDSLFAILVLIYKNIIGLKQSFTLDQEAQLLSYDLQVLKMFYFLFYLFDKAND